MATKDNKDKRKRKTAGKKKAKVSHIIKPENLSMEEWQVKLRRQIAEPAKLKIRCVDDELCPGEYLVGNPLTANEYKVVYRGATANGTIAPAGTSRHQGWEHASTLKL